MPHVQTTLPDYGAKSGMLASHSWAAGNTGVPFYYGFDVQLEKTVKFLQAGNYLNVDIFALKKAGSDNLIAPLGSVPFRLAPQDVVDAYVVIQNKNIGHSLIPEVRDLYQAWVEFEVKDASGKLICHSGFINQDGSLDKWAHSFTNRPINEDGKFVDNHQVQTIHSVAYDNTIQAGRSTLIRYRFQVPENVKGPITVTANVNYRHFRQSYINNVLGKDHPAYPLVQIASRSRELKIGDNTPVASQTDENPDWMRWNNFGIADYDEVQYADAVNAFNEVVKLRPEYADAYTNIALVDISWEKYDVAWSSIQQALSLSPNDARALYYASQLERRASHPQEELADLLKVVVQFPDSRDARRELGIAYYRLGDANKALDQFEALQAIDPDDLVAHYNLAILYRRKGMKEQAATQQKLFVTEKINSSARSLAFGYLRDNQPSAMESIPWHVHNLLPGASHENFKEKTIAEGMHP